MIQACQCSLIPLMIVAVAESVLIYTKKQLTGLDVCVSQQDVTRMEIPTTRKA